MREIRTSGLTRERAPNGPSLLYNLSSSSIFLPIGMQRLVLRFLLGIAFGRQQSKIEDEDEFEDEDDCGIEEGNQK